MYRLDSASINKILSWILLIGVFILFFWNCSRPTYDSSYKVCDNIYVEEYTVFGSGALGGDLMRKYLTDSLTFRIDIGEYDNYDNSIVCKCIGDSVYIENIAGRNSKIRITGSTSYKISDLRAKDNY